MQQFTTFTTHASEGVLRVTFDFPAVNLQGPEMLNACKQAVYESIDRPIAEALRAEAYWLYQATSKTPAIRRFTLADEQGLQLDLENQRNWNDLVLQVQDIE